MGLLPILMVCNSSRIISHLGNIIDWLSQWFMMWRLFGWAVLFFLFLFSLLSRVHFLQLAAWHQQIVLDCKGVCWMINSTTDSSCWFNHSLFLSQLSCLFTHGCGAPRRVFLKFSAMHYYGHIADFGYGRIVVRFLVLGSVK